MSKQSDARKQPPPEVSEGHALGPLPDGGLEHSMPEWLRRRPAWELDDTSGTTTRPDAERQALAPAQLEPVRPVPVPPASTASAQPEPELELLAPSATTDLPVSRVIEPDNTPIDPARLVAIEDLPVWLQRIAERSTISKHVQDVEVRDPPVLISSPEVETSSQPPIVTRTMSPGTEADQEGFVATRTPGKLVSVVILGIVIIIALWIAYYLKLV